MPEMNPEVGGSDTTRSSGQARTNLVEQVPLSSGLVGIRNPVVVRPAQGTLVLRTGRGTWVYWVFLLILPILALANLRAGSWFWTLYFSGLALLFWYPILLLLVFTKATEAPIAFACFDRDSQCMSTRGWFRFNRRRRPFSEIRAVQLVSAVGKT
jgi:hypothetical protein